MPPPPMVDRPAVRYAPPAPRRWLLFVHQLPASPSNLRVRTWRRLQQLGAIPLRQSVYVLPDTEAAREDFEWLKTEVRTAGGEASVFTADSVDAWSDDAIVEEFRGASRQGYEALAGEMERALKQAPARRPRGNRLTEARRPVERFRERLARLERTDFFGAPGRDRVVMLLARLEAPTCASPGRGRPGPRADAADAGTYANRLWVTRPRPGVDRMGSAWLVRRFVDPAARFAFAPDRASLPAGDPIPFDMFGVKFSHHGEGCTFETLCAVFGIEDPAVARIAAIVHDLDLKDDRFGPQEATTVGTVIDGLQLATIDDHELLERGISLFESLYCAFAQAARSKQPGPRPDANRARPPRPVAAARGRHARARRRR